MRAVAMCCERVPLLLLADSFDGFRDLVQVTFQGSLQKRALVGEVLIQGPDRHAGSRRHPGRGQPLLSDIEQNLNGRFENRVHAGGRTRLNGRFTRL